MRNARELVTITCTRMIRHGLTAAIFCAVLSLPGALAAEESSTLAQSQTVVKKKDGLRFNVPSDWPVEERNGAVGPIPIEEYLAKKFAGLESRLRVLEQQVNSYDLRLRVLEEAKKPARPSGALRSGEQTEASQ